MHHMNALSDSPPHRWSVLRMHGRQRMADQRDADRVNNGGSSILLAMEEKRAAKLRCASLQLLQLITKMHHE